MADPDPVLTAWQAAGTDLTMLPSGVEVRLEQVPVAEMIRSGFLPSGLRQLALRFATPDTGVKPDELEAKGRADWAELERLMISRSVTAFRWTCPCAECVARRPEPIEERPLRLEPETLAADPPVLPRVDLVALSDIVLYIRNQRQVDAISRVAHQQMEPEEAARILEAERVNTIEGWGSFRDLGRGVDAHAHGDDVGGSPVAVSGPNRADRRARPRRGARGAVDPGAQPPGQPPAGS